MAQLRADPDWAGAAQALVSALEAQPTADGRVEVVDACREDLGEAVYPAFIKLLAAVARFGDAPARALAADAFAHALATSKLPSARVPAFGGGGLSLLGGGLGGRLGGGLGGEGLRTHLRSVGPIEYLCLWARRDLANEALDADAFETALGWLLRLFDASPRAAVLYQAKLAADVESPVEGLHDRDSRALVRALLDAWEAGGPAQEVAARTRGALRRDGFAALSR